MNRNIYILLFFVFSALVSNAQRSNLIKAVQAIKAGQLEEAKAYLDTASTHEDTKEKPETWYYKGFVLKDIYTQTQKSNPKSPARLEAIEAFKTFYELDTANSDLKASATKSLNFLATTVYNDAVNNLNTQNYETSIENFSTHKSTVRIFDPERNFVDMDKQFHRVLATVYNQIYDEDKENNKEFFNKTKNEYLFVLDLDSNDTSANYNLGILFYNEAVTIIKSLEFEIDLITLELIQDQTVELFRQSLPYMRKAYELNPKRKETLIGLSGIYFSLNEMEKSEEIQEKLEKLDENE